jgi:signal transduction histidine kinase
VNLRTQLTLAFLGLALVPCAVVSIVSLRQLVEIKELWESAGFDRLLNRVEVVADRSLERMRYDLENAAQPLAKRWEGAIPNLDLDSRERLYAARFMANVGFDVALIYARARDGYRLESGIFPDTTAIDFAALAREVAEYDPALGPLESSTGAFVLVRDVSPDRRVVIGYLLDRGFFLSLAEIRLDIGVLRALFQRMRVLQATSMRLVAALLGSIALVAVAGGWVLSRRLAGPVSDLSRQIERMTPGPRLAAVTEPPSATREVRALASAFNALTARLAATQADLLRAERAAGSALVARHFAHEILNPLSTLGLATRRLETRLSTLPEREREESREALSAMRAEFAVLEEMATTFSELGRIAEPADRHPIDLNELVRSVYALHAGGAVTFETDLAPALPRVPGDERALRRVLSNLVKNAIEAQPEGGRVVLRTRPAPGGVEFAVEDEGPGMAEETRRHAFDAGFSTKNRGSGVGLFLARAIVEQHGGRIRIEGRSGPGTAVRVELQAAETSTAA